MEQIEPTLFDLFLATLRQELERNRMSQRDLARASGVHYVTVSRILSGQKRNIRLDTVDRLLKATRAAPEKIFQKNS